jgi:WD40 repeat protein
MPTEGDRYSTHQPPQTPGGYSAPPGGYSAPPGGYSAPPGGYSAPPGGYSAPPGYPGASAPTLPNPGQAPAPAAWPVASGAAGRIGPYVVEGEVARGGMGIVYRARHVELARPVALKMLLEDARPEAVERFRREAQAAARLRHPNVVGVHQVGIHMGRPYLAMDWIEGETLAAQIRNAPLEPKTAAGMLLKVARAVGEAHSLGVLHRDLKPSNIIVTPAGEPVLTDFGLAKDLADADESGLTQAGQLLGTPSYMAPEQAEGDLERVDRRADVYGLGATLYAAVVGRPPFQGDSVISTLKAVLYEAPIPPRAQNPDIPRDLDTVIRVALAKEPERRYSTASALADDLQRFLEGAPVAASSPSALNRLAYRARRQAHILVPLAFALALAALALGFLYANWVRTKATASQAKADLSHEAELRELAEAGKKRETLRGRRRGMELVAERELEAAYVQLRLGLLNDAASAFLTAEEHVAAFLEKEESEEGDVEVRLRAAVQRGLRTVIGMGGYQRRFGGGEYLCTFGPEPDQVYGLSSKKCVVYDARRGEVVGKANSLRLPSLNACSRSPDGRFLALSCKRELLVVELPSLRPLWRQAGTRHNVRYSFDGSMLACSVQQVSGKARGAIELRRASDGKLVRLFLSDQRGGNLTYAASPECLDFSPNGQFVVVGYGDGTLSMWRLADGAHVAVIVLTGAIPRKLRFTPEGTVVIGDTTGALTHWQPGQNPITVQTSQHTPVRSMVWIPKRRALAVGHEDGRIDLWAFPGPQAYSEIVATRLHTFRQSRSVTSLTVNEEEDILVSAGERGVLRAWRLDHVRVYGGGGPVAVSPDGERLAWQASRRFGRDQVILHGPDGDQRIELGDRRFRRRVRLGLGFFPDSGLLLIPIAPHPSSKEPSRVEVWRVDADPPKRVGQVACENPGPVLALDRERFLVGRADEAAWGKSGLILRALASRAEPVSSMRWHGGGVLALTRVGDHVASASTDGTVALWSQRGRRRSPLSLLLRNGLRDLSQEPAELDDATYKRLWESHVGGPPRGAGTRLWASAVAISPTGRSIAVGYGDGSVRVWDLNEALPPQLLYGHSGRVVGAHFLEERLLVTAAGDGTLRLWDAEAQRELRRILLGTSATHFAAHGRRVLVSTAGQLVWEFDLGAPSRAPTTEEELVKLLPVDSATWRTGD